MVKSEGISDVSLLESIVKIISSSIGSPISIKTISDTINSSGRKISVNTVDNYIRALTESSIFYKVDRYDIKGRQHLKTLGKYYIVDTGIRHMLLSNIAPRERNLNPVKKFWVRACKSMGVQALQIYLNGVKYYYI